jgi:hypothetical protein
VVKEVEVEAEVVEKQAEHQQRAEESIIKVNLIALGHVQQNKRVVCSNCCTLTKCAANAAHFPKYVSLLHILLHTFLTCVHILLHTFLTCVHILLHTFLTCDINGKPCGVGVNIPYNVIGRWNAFTHKNI